MDDDAREGSALGRAMRVRRAELDLKRGDLAKRAELSYPYISEIENGVKEPSAKALRRIAEALDLDLSDLMALQRTVGDLPPTGTSALLSAPESAPRPSPSSASFALVGPTDAFPTSGSYDERADLRALVRAELDTWSRHVLPSIVRAEVDRQLATHDREAEQP